MGSDLPIPGLPPSSSQRLLQVVLQNPGAEEVWLFGSRAMGSHREGSDVDHVNHVGVRLWQRLQG